MTQTWRWWKERRLDSSAEAGVSRRAWPEPGGVGKQQRREWEGEEAQVQLSARQVCGATGASRRTWAKESHWLWWPGGCESVSEGGGRGLCRFTCGPVRTDCPFKWAGLFFFFSLRN